MDGSKIIQYAISGMITALLTSALTVYLGKSKPEFSEGKKIMKMPKIYLVFSFCLFGLSVLVVYNFLDFNTIKTLFGVIGLFMGFGCLNCILLYKKHFVEYDDESIRIISWLGKKSTIKWNEIENITYSQIASSLKVEFRGNRAYIHEHIKGYKTFIKKVEEITDLKLK